MTPKSTSSLASGNGSQIEHQTVPARPGPARPGQHGPARPGLDGPARPSPARPARPGPATLGPPPPPLVYQKNNGFHGNRSTKPGMAARELVYEEKYRELAGLSNQIITSMRLGSWRPRRMENASREKRKKLKTGPPQIVVYVLTISELGA